MKYTGLTSAEKLVMKTIWDGDHEMALAEITKSVNDTYKRGWKPQTVSTFISKLVQKKYVKMKREGRRIVYEILISLEDYRAEEAADFVNFWNGGSVADFLSSFFKDRKPGQGELDELKKRLDEIAK